MFVVSVRVSVAHGTLSNMSGFGPPGAAAACTKLWRVVVVAETVKQSLWLVLWLHQSLYGAPRANQVPVCAVGTDGVVCPQSREAMRVRCLEYVCRMIVC